MVRPEPYYEWIEVEEEDKDDTMEIAEQIHILNTRLCLWVLILMVLMLVVILGNTEKRALSQQVATPNIIDSLLSEFCMWCGIFHC